MSGDKRPKTAIPSAESFSAPEAAGYLFKIIHEGWLRKRWRKRYCVLSNGILYFYEFKTSDGTEKTCSSLNLKSFGECIIAPKKECKKSPNTFILEPSKLKNDSKDVTKKVVREFLYTETPEEREKWMAKLQEAITLTSIGGKAKLNHVTKTRARPPGGGNRRPPTKQHLRERALMSEVGLEEVKEEAKENGSSKTRGHKPTNALKPAPGMKPKAPNASPKPKTNNEETEEEMKSSATEASTLDLPTPPPTPKSPTPPPAALKPTSIKRMPVSETESMNSAEEDSHSGSPVKETDTVNDTVSTSSNPSIRKDERPKSEQSSESSEPSISDVTTSKQPVVDIVNSDTDSHKEHSSSPSRDKDDSSPTKSSPQIQKLKGQLDFNFLNVNGQLRTEDRMEKAKSMMELDVDIGLPPPPSPPPDSPNENTEQEDGKKGKKGKKKKVRPSSLVFSI